MRPPEPALHQRQVGEHQLKLKIGDIGQRAGETIGHRRRSIRLVIERPYHRHQRVNGAEAANPGGLGAPVALTEAGIGKVHVLHLGVDALAVGIQRAEVVEPRVRHLDNGSVHRRATLAQARRLPALNESREKGRLATLREPDDAQLEHNASHTRRDHVTAEVYRPVRDHPAAGPAGGVDRSGRGALALRCTGW